MARSGVIWLLDTLVHTLTPDPRGAAAAGHTYTYEYSTYYAHTYL